MPLQAVVAGFGALARTAVVAALVAVDRLGLGLCWDAMPLRTSIPSLDRVVAERPYAMAGSPHLAVYPASTTNSLPVTTIDSSEPR